MKDAGIFTKGNDLKSKVHRQVSWFRVKKYWLLMPAKEYKSWYKRYAFTSIFTILSWTAIGSVATYYGLLGVYEFVDSFRKAWKKRNNKKEES